MTTAYLFDNIPVRQLDNNGAPQSGAKLHTWIAGTTSPLATYTDSTATTPLSNPVVADAQGFFPQVWGLGSTYDLECRKSDDTSILWNALTVELGGAETAINAFAEPGGSNNVGFIAAGAGATGRTSQDKMREAVNVRDRGAEGDGSTDDWTAVLAAKTYSNRIHFPRIGDVATTYYIGTGFTSGALDGVTISTDANVTISFAASNYSYFKLMICATDVRVFWRDISIPYTFKATPSYTEKQSLALPAPALKRNRIALDCTNAALVTSKINAWPTDDTFASTTSTTASDSVSFGTTGSNVFRGAFVELGACETVSGYFDLGIAPGPIGVIIRGTLGFTIIYSSTATGNYVNAQKLTGIAATGNTPNLGWTNLGQGSYDSFAPGNTVWSVSKISNNLAVVKVNGKTLTQPYAQGVGDILEVGFVCFGTAAFSVSALTVERRTDAVLSMPPLSEIRIYGDSTAESLPTSWDQYLRPLLDTYYGVPVAAVTNFAISGQTLAQQYASMQTNGFGNAYYVLVCAGTNDIQGSSSIASFKTLVTNVINLIAGAGRKPVLVIPWMWYARSLNPDGAIGQNTTGYDAGAPYRMWMERIGFALSAIVVKLTDELPNPAPSLVTSQPLNPLVRDNIHPDQMAYQLYAMAACKAIVDDYLSMPDSIEESLTSTLLLNGATAGSDLRLCYDKTGRASIAGTLNVTTITDGTAVIRIPRHIAPTHGLNVTVTAISAANAVLGTCWLNIDPTSGTAKLSKVPATSTQLIFSGGSWKTQPSAT